jgi:hypothetical protein
MADLTPEQAITQLKSMPEDRQRAILSKLSPEVKKGILGKLTAAPNAGLASPVGVPPQGKLPNGGDTGEGVIARNMTSFENQLSQMPKATVQLLLAKHWPIVDSHNYKELWEDIKSLNPVMREFEGGGIDWGGTAANLLPLLIDAKGRGIKESPGLSGARTVANKVSELRNAMAPKEIPIGGENIPVLKGEAEPGTTLGRMQAGLKRAGIGEGAFTKFAQEQQGKVKQVIRNVAQQTSGMLGPMKDEPGEAMADAEQATFAKARPMYDALDKSLATVPDTLTNVSKVTEQAIARAKKLGAEITEGGGESVVVNGRTFTPETDPVAWKTFQEQGLVPSASGQPLSTYMKIRSQLLKMQRTTADAALRNKIGDEVQAMNRNMEAVLKDTPLHENWTEANRLWSKGYALRDIADAIRKRTSGTPVGEQAGGISKVPTRLRGASLVQRLNDLSKSGVLQKGLTPEEASNLRQSADILDRASERAGKEFKVGYGPHSTIWRNLIGLPFLPLVRAMTTRDGMLALKAGNATAFTRAVSGTTSAAGATAGNTLRSLQGKPESKSPGQQIRDLNAIRSGSNPNMPSGEER